MLLEPDAVVDLMPRGETPRPMRGGAVLLHTGREVVRVADIERAVVAAGEEVGGKEHGRAWVREVWVCGRGLGPPPSRG